MDQQVAVMIKRGWLELPDGDVVLRMSKEDYQWLVFALGLASARENLSKILGLMNRLNDGNPNYLPYEIPKPSSPVAPDSPSQGSA